uniref:Uncharacterized protein n=1 Tax=Anguilla anguilla TaxID=7936 RepID=A0A0E9R3B2_ANGAN
MKLRARSLCKMHKCRKAFVCWQDVYG